MISLNNYKTALRILLVCSILAPSSHKAMPPESQKHNPIVPFEITHALKKDCIQFIKIFTKIIIKSLRMLRSMPALNSDIDHALLYACQRNDLIQIKKYIILGANINAHNKNGFTPLHYACLYNSLEIVKLLTTKKNAIANTTNIARETPLLCAFTNENSDIFHLVAQALYVQNVKIDYQKLLNNTHTCNQIKLLERLSQESLHTFTLDYQALLRHACAYNNIHIVKFCITKGANIHDAQAFTQACYHNHTTIIDTLIAHGIDINAPNHMGFTALHYACSQNHHDLVVSLVEQGAHVNALSNYLMSPLHCVINATTAAYLIAHGAKLQIRNSYRQTPLDFALEKNRHTIAQLLQSAHTSDQHFTEQSPLSTTPVELVQRFIACHIHAEYVVHYFTKESQDIQKELVKHAFLHNNYNILAQFSSFKNCYKLLTLQ